MKFMELTLKGAYQIKLEPYIDERGSFARLFCKDELNKIAHDKEIVQINNSFTKQKGAVRGLHFQYPPKAEIKFIKCMKGKVFDVAVDIRKKSTTFLKWHGEVLTEDNFTILYIPQGFAHGFQTLEDNTELLYFHSEYYSSKWEGGILYNDPAINITWPLDVTDISQRDMKHPLLTDKFEGLEV